MKNFEKKIENFKNIKSELDCHIWDIFSRYIEQEEINFNYPVDWKIGEWGDDIYFYGKDGCRGCYDEKTLSIPIKFFIDPEKEFNSLASLREEQRKEKLKQELKLKEEKEKKEFERLKSKFA